LSQTDAFKVGIDPSGLDYDIPVTTANGMIRLAVTNIAKFQIGEATFWNVRVLISPRDDGSVVGVNTLRRFRSYTVEGDKLTLRW
jgi:aspartyl protease family protein